MIDVQELGWVEGHKLQRLFLWHAAVLVSLGRFLVQAARHLGIVGVEGRHHALVVKHRPVVRDGVFHLVFVGPPVAEAGASGTVLRHLVGHLVPLENVGEGVEAEAERIGHMHEHVDLVLAVAVAGHEAFLVEDLKERFQFQIHAWRHRTPSFTDVLALGVSKGGAVLNLGLAVLTGPNEVVVVHLLHPHARLREARAITVAPIALFHVLPERELDERHGFLEQEVLGLDTPTEFDDGALAANGVGRAVEDLGACHATGKLAVHVHVLAVHGVSNPNLGAARLCAFVHAAVHGDVRVFVDDAWRHVLAATVDFQRGHAGGQQLSRVEVSADGHQGPVVEEHVRPVQDTVGLACPHRGVANPRGLGRQPFWRAVGCEGVHHARKIELRGIRLFRRCFRFGDLRRVLIRFCRCDRFRVFRDCVFSRLGVANGRPVGPLAGGGLA